MDRILALSLAFAVFLTFACGLAVAQRGGGGGRAGSSGTAAPSIGRSTGGVPSPPSTNQGSTPPSVIGTPMQQAAPVAPLSPSLPQPSESSGGSTQGGTGSGARALSPGSGVGDTGSPSENAPSAPGGGGKSLQDCMGFWDKGTHMSKAEWRAACLRIQHRIDNAR